MRDVGLFEKNLVIYSPVIIRVLEGNTDVICEASTLHVWRPSSYTAASVHTHHASSSGAGRVLIASFMWPGWGNDMIDETQSSICWHSA